MRKLATFAAIGALTLGGATVISSEAEANGRRGAVVAASIAGLAAGAIIASSAARAHAYPGYGYAYPVSNNYRYAEPVYIYRPRPVVRVVVDRPYYAPAYHRGWGRAVHPHWREAHWRHGHWRDGPGHHRHYDRPRCWLPERHLCR